MPKIPRYQVIPRYDFWSMSPSPMSGSFITHQPWQYDASCSSGPWKAPQLAPALQPETAPQTERTENSAASCGLDTAASSLLNSDGMKLHRTRSLAYDTQFYHFFTQVLLCPSVD